MAGRGPAPKHPATRRNRHSPQRGEWIELPPQTEPAPDLPEDGWSDRTRAAWLSWWSDPASTQFGPADMQLLLDLAFIYEQWVRRPTAMREGEIRQRLDSLGLSPKGRQDRRWRLPGEEVEEEPEKTGAEADAPDPDELARRRAEREARKAAGG